MSVASQIVVAVQALITRRTNPLESILIGIGKLDAGTAYNVVAQEASQHNSNFDIDEDALTIMVNLMSVYAVEFLNGQL